MATLGILAAVAAAVALIATPVSSTTQERSQSDPTAWWWYYDQTEAQVTQLINDNQARIVDIEVQQISPSFLFSVAMVRNEGAYAKTWWWYYHATVASISDFLVANNARLVDIDTYFIFNSMTFNLERYYSAVMISNTGADQKNWSWYVDRTPAEIVTLHQTNNARLIDIERHDPSAGTFNVIMEACPCPDWWWYHGVSETQVNDFATQNEARIVDVETYDVGGDTRFAVVMIDNSQPTPTATDTPTATPTDTPAAAPTATDTPTATPTDTPTATPTDTPTAAPPATDTPTPTGLNGDASCDGTVNSVDAALVLQFAAGLSGAVPCPEDADADKDGDIDAIDAALILQFTAGLLDTLPP